MKRFTLLAKLMVLGGIFLILAGTITAHFGKMSDDSTALIEVLEVTTILVGAFTCIAGCFIEAQELDIFEKIFGFDPRPGKSELAEPDRQQVVSKRIELLRREAQSIFLEETNLYKNRSRDSRETNKALALLVPEKLQAKNKFWRACKSARIWGYAAPTSINESAIAA